MKRPVLELPMIGPDGCDASIGQFDTGHFLEEVFYGYQYQQAAA